MIVSGFRAALDLDTYPLSNLIRPWCTERAKPGRGKPSLIMHIAFSACFHTVSLERNRFSKIAKLFSIPLYTALKLLVLPISRLVACSARIVVDNKQTNIQTPQTKYCDPRCACVPRVNCRHCIKRTRDKTRIYSIPHGAPGA